MVVQHAVSVDENVAINLLESLIVVGTVDEDPIQDGWTGYINEGGGCKWCVVDGEFDGNGGDSGGG